MNDSKEGEAVRAHIICRPWHLWCRLVLPLRHQVNLDQDSNNQLDNDNEGDKISLAPNGFTFTSVGLK